jgi:UDP-glucose 4-epimerase
VRGAAIRRELLPSEEVLLRKALITGGAGFVGEALARSLIADGVEVHIVDNFSRGVRDPAVAMLREAGGVRLFDADLTSPDTHEKFDRDYEQIFHLAAIIGVKNVLERPFEVLRDNTAMLANMLAAAGNQRQLSRFVFASTSEIYAGSLEHLDMPVPTPEDTPLALTDLDHPRTSYMLSKIYGEAMCLHSGLPVTIVRPHNVYGPRMGMSHVIPELLQRTDAAPPGDGLTVYSPEHKRTFCFIDDAVALLKVLASTPAASGETFNLGAPGPEVEMAELARLVIATVGKQMRLEPGATSPGSPARRCADMSKASQLTGVTAKVTLEEGVRQTWEWYRDNVFSGKMKSAS